MIQSRAREILADFRAEVARIGYDGSDKRHIAVLFADLRYWYLDTKNNKNWSTDGKVQQAKFDKVTALENQWQKDRINPELHAGADTIESILQQLEKFIPDLPKEIVVKKEYFPPIGAAVKADDVERMVDEALKRRGVQAGVV